MTLIKPDGDDGTARDFMDMAVEHFNRAIGVFLRATKRIETGQDEPSPENDRLVRLYTHATEVLIKEKLKLENNIKTDAGIVYDFALDFEGAREEIRRRMACLRDAGNAGKVSD